MRKTSLVFPLPPSLKRLHPVSRRWGARTSSGVEVQVSRVHRVLATVAWGGGYMWVLQDLTSLDNYSVFLSPSTLRTYHWVSFRCSGNICCCESTGIQCTAQSLSAWCGRWRLARNIDSWHCWFLMSNCQTRSNTYQNVVWLDVPVDESHLVHAVHSADQLGDVEPGGINFCMGKLFLATLKKRFWFWRYLKKIYF